MWLSTRMPGPPGACHSLIGPGEGMKVLASSALMRHSIAWPVSLMSFCVNLSFSPEAIISCAFTRSMPVISSVTGCSTWMRVFISMK